MPINTFKIYNGFSDFIELQILSMTDVTCNYYCNNTHSMKRKIQIIMFSAGNRQML